MWALDDVSGSSCWVPLYSFAVWATSLQTWATKASVVSRQVGSVLWAGAAWHSRLGTGQRQGWSSVSKRRILLEPLPAAAPATAHGSHSLMGPDFIALGWRATEKGPLHFLLKGFKELLQRGRSTDAGCSERRRLKKRDQSASFPNCPLLRDLIFGTDTHHEHLLISGGMGGGGSWWQCSVRHYVRHVELGKPLRDTMGDVEGCAGSVLTAMLPL